MPVTNFPFRQVTPGALMRPVLMVKYINPDTGISLPAWSLIDTGADICALPSDFAVLLGLDLEAGEKASIVGVGCATSGYKHALKVEMDGFQAENIPVCFLPDLKAPLIGVDSFLSNFKLSIDYPKQLFSLNFSEPADPNDNPNSWGTI